MRERNSMKIVYCINTLSTVGGVESITVTKANALADIPGNSVWIITCCDNSLLSAFPVSNKVGLLGVRGGYNGVFPWNLINMAIQNRKKRKALQGLFKQIEPDVVISTGGVDKWIIPFVSGSWAKVREIHAVKHYRKKIANTLIMKAMMAIVDIFDYYVLAKRYDHLVVLTHEDLETNWSKTDNVCVIPNPVRFTDCNRSALIEKKVVSVGRLTMQKNYTSLIRSFRIVADRHPDWRLDIVGEGEEREKLEKLILKLSLKDNIFLHGVQTNVEDWMSQASLFVLTSLYEGFALVLVEAMRCGLPVVSYACPAGPRDIISDGMDGFLVPESDEVALAQRMCQLIEDVDMRKQMGKEAFASSARYDLSIIIRQWMDLFNKLTLQKQNNDNQFRCPRF